MPGQPATNVRGLKEFRRDLKALEGQWPKELAKVHRDLARTYSTRARSVAGGLSKMQAAAAKNIKGYGTAGKASIGVSNTGTVPWARSAFWGQRYPTGWFAGDEFGGPRRRLDPGEQGQPAWIGNQWDAGDRRGGPYAINQVIADGMPQILAEYRDMIDDLADRAFND